MKERYETPELEIVEFNEEEILTGNVGYTTSDIDLPTKPSSTNF